MHLIIDHDRSVLLFYQIWKNIYQVFFHVKAVRHTNCFYKTIFFCVCIFSHVQLFVTPWNIAHQAPLSMGFSRQEYWSGLPFSTPGDLLNPDLCLFHLLHWQADSLPLYHLGSPWTDMNKIQIHRLTYFTSGGWKTISQAGSWLCITQPSFLLITHAFLDRAIGQFFAIIWPLCSDSLHSCTDSR